MLFRWLVGLSTDDAVWLPTVFGWAKSIGRARQVMAAYNLTRMRTLGKIRLQVA